MSETCKVVIDDNYHYMDESKRSVAGTYNSLEEAIERCKEKAKDCCKKRGNTVDSTLTI